MIKSRVSKYAVLEKADAEQLAHYELIAEGMGIHWPLLDEDLSLKVFLQDEITRFSQLLVA